MLVVYIDGGEGQVEQGECEHGVKVVGKVSGEDLEWVSSVGEIYFCISNI